MGGKLSSRPFLHGAEAYERHIGRYGRELAQELIKFADVRSGQRVLDVGCGPGALTRQLAALLGAEQVAAIDPSPDFVQACQDRVPGVRAEVAAAEALPFADGTFDRALAQLVVNFMTDAVAGVREMRRVTRSGGILAAAVWDYAGQMRLLRHFWDSVVALDPSAADLHEGNSMRYATPDELQALWIDAGLKRLRPQPLRSRPAMKDSRIYGIRWSRESLRRARTSLRSPAINGRPSRPTFKSASALELSHSGSAREHGS